MFGWRRAGWRKEGVWRSSQSHDGSGNCPGNAAKSLLQFALGVASSGAQGLVINNHGQDAVQIRAQVEALAPCFEFISYDDLPSRLGGRRSAKPFCLLTFDDGRAINAEETAPELLRLGIPAVFYLVTGHTGTNQPLWFDQLSAMRISHPAEVLPINEELKALPWRDRDNLLNQHALRLGFDPKQSSPQVMTWEQARRLQRDGFELGSHTVDHAILVNETESEARRQLVQSYEDMTRNGLRCRTFAFPNGCSHQSLVSMALEVGFENTMTTAPTWVRRHTLPCLPRLYLKDSGSASYVAGKAAVARLGFVLRNPNGEGRRYVWSPGIVHGVGHQAPTPAKS